MKRILFLFFIFFAAFSADNIQKELITLNWYFPKDGDFIVSDIGGMTFENAAYPVAGSQIPVFVKDYQLTEPGQNFRFTIENAKYEEFTAVHNFTFNDDLKEESEVETIKLKSGDNYKIQLQVTTVVRKGEKIFLLKSFELQRVPLLTKSAVISAHNWKTGSVLQSGKWLKIKTSGKGIYKIPYSKLSSWGFFNPSQVNVFGSGGTILSENPAEITYDDVQQCAVWHGKNNGVDCLFFYEPGNIHWKPIGTDSYFEHTPHNYSNQGFFFLTENAGTAKTVEKLAEEQQPATVSVTSFDEFDVFEKDDANLIRSGRKWFGQMFGNGASQNFSFSVPDLESPGSVRVRVNSAARSYAASKMTISGNGTKLGELSFIPVNTSDNTALYADERKSVFTIPTTGNTLTVGLKYEAGNNNAFAWLDYIEINYRRKLNMTGGAMFFRDVKSVGSGNVIEFSIEGSNSSTQVFDVTDMNQVTEIPLQYSGTVAKGKRPAEELREYVAFNPGGTFPEPELIGEIENQNLHGMNTPEFLIITHSNFMEAANSLANFHRSYDGMNVEVVNADKIYNEFSSGIKDATGIRNFIKMFYDRGKTLKYVLLMGDGSYDNKNINTANLNFIPTFQSENSLNPVASFVTDDYFVILDDNESVYNGAVDLGIGRIPASTKYQAELVVNKILNYYSPEALGNWRNMVCFIADDGDGNLHMSDSEKLSGQVNTNHNEFVTDKIYFDAFVQETTTSGESYPDVTEAINKRVDEGILVLNYVGHANERFLADEHVLDVSNINAWSNAKKLPIFVTATCEFSRFDGDETSAGEYVLFNATGGGIGLFSTTRVVFAYSNFLLSRSFYNFVFQRDANGEHYRMGDIMRLAKINTINTTNKRNFSLLADPALKLSYPKHKVVTTTVNLQNATASPDTIGALQTITISGFIADYSGKKLDNFTGQIIPTVYDKAVTMKTLGNAGGTPMEFKVQENVIYKGLSEVKNGEFTFRFVVPKDISYNLGNAKVIYYADDGTTDAHGAFENLVIGGPGSSVVDNEGPQIRLYMDTEDFVSGGETSNNPTLLAFLSDEIGINTVGTGIGHDIVAVLDDDYSNALVLNKYYQANVNDFTSGVIRFPLKNLSAGKHTLKLKAWDVANNSSEAEIEFVVSGDFFISRVASYPNPMNDYTFFAFEHNQAGATLDVFIEIFDQAGRRISYMKSEIGSSGTLSNPIRWDLEESAIVPRSGIYIYRIVARNSEGAIASKSGKMMISN